LFDAVEPEQVRDDALRGEFLSSRCYENMVAPNFSREGRAGQ
jgi:hypothetical protein